MEVAFDSIPQWEMDALLTTEADPILDSALQVVDEMTFEQQLALLDKLGIDYSHLLAANDEQDEPEPETADEEFAFADLF